MQTRMHGRFLLQSGKSADTSFHLPHCRCHWHSIPLFTECEFLCVIMRGIDMQSGERRTGERGANAKEECQGNENFVDLDIQFGIPRVIHAARPILRTDHLLLCPSSTCSSTIRSNMNNMYVPNFSNEFESSNKLDLSLIPRSWSEGSKPSSNSSVQSLL